MLRFIDPGKPMQNGYVERFNGPWGRLELKQPDKHDGIREEQPRTKFRIFYRPRHAVLPVIGTVLILLTSASVSVSRTNVRSSTGNFRPAACTTAGQSSELALSSPLQPSGATASLDFLRGMEYENKRDYAAAERQFRTAWFKSPQNGNYAQRLALLYIGQKRYNDAQEVINRYKALCGSIALTYSLQAESLFQQRKYDIARREAEASLRLSSRNPRMHEILGLILIAGGSYLTALPELRVAVKEEPADPQIRYYYGRLLYSTGRYPQALEEFLACLKLQPTYPRALANVGLCYEALQEFEKAENAYKKAIEQNQAEPESENIEAVDYYGALLARLGRYPEAIKTFETALAINPKDFRAYFELGKMFLTNGEFTNAQRYLSRAIVIDPKFSRTYYLMGRLCEKEHRVKDATRYFGVFQELNTSPENREFPFPKQ